MLHLRELRVLHCVVCLERQRGCGKIGLLLRQLFPPLNAACPARAWWALQGHFTPGRGGRVKTNQTKSLHISRRVEIMRRDFVVQISIFSMPRCLGSENPSKVVGEQLVGVTCVDLG